MTDKTCGNCANGECEAIRCLITQDTHVPCFVCADYIERTDSVERIALDMLALIKAARMRPIVLDPNKMPGGQIFVPLPETEFADRLRVLGIEVPE